jgi:thioredoxin-dependent peroxiredoxin
VIAKTAIQPSGFWPNFLAGRFDGTPGDGIALNIGERGVVIAKTWTAPLHFARTNLTSCYSGKRDNLPRERKFMPPIEPNDEVADFTLQDEQDKTVHLSDFAGKPVVLFFYPKADTPGCTIEACGFRDIFAKIQKSGAVVLGISRDTPKAQKKFKEKYDLPYTLLADVDEVVCKQFDVLKEKNMYGKKVMGIERTTFLIGPDQHLIQVFRKVKPEGHAEEVLEAVKEYAKAHKA